MIDSHCQPEAGSFAQIKRRNTPPVPKVVLAHQVHRLASKQADPVELSAIEEHHAESRIIFQSRHLADSRHKIERFLLKAVLLRALGRLDPACLLPRPTSWHRHLKCSEPAPFRFGYEETRVLHAKRLKDLFV